MVPFDTIWRTGANLATHFTTSRDLIIGDARIPAGTYTLWTVLSPRGDTLVVNTQTGQWGTVYSATNDLVRIPLRTDNSADHVEQFTITIVPNSTGADIVLSWARRRMRAGIWGRLNPTSDRCLLPALAHCSGFPDVKRILTPSPGETHVPSVRPAIITFDGATASHFHR